MSVAADMRRSALNRYLIYRIKLLELIHLSLIWGALKNGFAPENVMSHGSQEFAATIRTYQISCFAVLVDKSRDGMDAFELWRQLFPKHKARINKLWTRIEPAWQTVRAFRDNVGFHAGKPKDFFVAKEQIRTSKQVAQAVTEFLELAKFFLEREADDIPDFAENTEELLLKLEIEEHLHFDRSSLRRALVLPYELRYQKTFY